MELKDLMLYIGSGGIVLNILVLVYFYGLSKLSDLILLSTCYLAILVTVYFTYGVKIEKTLITKQISSVINDSVGIINIFNIKTDKKLNPNKDEANNNNSKNKNILSKTKKLITIVLFSGIIVSILLWMAIYRKQKMFNIKNYIINIVAKNIVLLLFVLAIQLIFTTFVTGKYLPLETKEVYKIIVNNII
jgi:hypothetical protein